MLDNPIWWFQAVCLLVLSIGLAVIVWTDIRSFRIPDKASLPLLATGLLWSAVRGGLPDALWGVAVGYGSFVGIELLYRRLRGSDGLGRGDAKLFAVAGAWLGWQGLPYVLLTAAASGLAGALFLRRRDTPIPFGPFLAASMLIVLVVRLVG